MKRQIKSRKNKIVLIIRIILLIVLLPVVIVWLAKNYINKINLKQKNSEKIHIYNISQLDAISGVDFEILLKDIFEKLGYNSYLTKRSHDYGADIIIEKGKNKAIVQAKCYNKTVGVKAVQEIVSARNHYGVTDTIVATNNYFSKEAVTLASENDVKLLDRTVLLELLKKTGVKVSTSNKKYTCLSSVEKQKVLSKYPHFI